MRRKGRRRRGITKKEVTGSRGENKQAKGGFLAYRMVQDNTLLVKRDAENGKLHSFV
jgi:hypothetical protein